MRRLLLVICTLLLLAAACSSDDDSDTTVADSETAPENAEATEEATEAPADTETPEPTATEAAEATPEPTAAVEENFASFTGVTEDTIKVGVTVPDFDALVEAGLSNHQGDADVAFQAYFDMINEQGGIAGRMIEPVYVGFNHISPVSQDEACTALTEDHEVFIVLYGLLAQNNLCLTELHETMVMTDQFQTAEVREQSGDTLWLQLRSTDDERTRIMGTVMADSGRLDGKTIGVLANGNLSGGADGDIMVQTLSDLGFESTLAVTTAPIEDITAQEEELKIIIERFKTEGVDFLFDVAGADNQDFLAEGFTPEIVEALIAVQGSEGDPALDGVLSVGPRPAEDFWFDPEFREACVDPIIEANPELEDEFSWLPSEEEQAGGNPNWSNTTRIACNQVLLLKELGEIAGADLSNDSIRAALDELGATQLHGYGQASFTSDGKWDGLDEFYIVQYSAASNSIEIVGDPIIVER